MAFQNNNQYQQQGYQQNYQQPQQNTVIPKAEYEVDGQNIKLTANFVRQNLVTGGGAVSDKEITMFLRLCKYQKLNPFTGDAYLIKYRSKGNYEQPAQQIISRQAFRKRAEANPHYAGTRSGVIVSRQTENGLAMLNLNGAVMMPTDELLGAWSEVKRDDREWVTHVEIGLYEFAKTRKDYNTGKTMMQSTWATMPMNMIVKTAEVNALRQAFPDSLSNLYTEDDKPVETPAEESTEKKDPKKVSELLKDKQPEPKQVPAEEAQPEPKKQPAKPVKEAAQHNKPAKTTRKPKGKVDDYGDFKTIDNERTLTSEEADAFRSYADSTIAKEKSSASNDQASSFAQPAHSKGSEGNGSQESLFENIDDTYRK